MSIQRSLMPLLATFSVLLSQSATAESIPVPNFSFEDPVLPDNNMAEFTNRDLPGWTKDFEDSPDVGGDNQGWGATNPALDYFGAVSPLPQPFDSNQLAFNNLLPGDTTSLVALTPVTKLNAGDVLMLEVAVGNLNGSNAGSADLSFEVGLTSAAGDDFGVFATTELPATGQIEDLTYTLDVDAEASAFIGEVAYVRLRATNLIPPLESRDLGASLF